MDVDKRKVRMLTAIFIITVVLTIFVYSNNQFRGFLISILPIYEKPWAVALSSTVVGTLVVLFINWISEKVKKK